MRLTLRTLLAWLDDTLSPAEVKEVGLQVSESPFAQELADRIHRVTRQRRLTVPGQSGTEPTDPNTVASYLDNELDADQVADYEKRCLTSDVHLAEVASAHQILSLIGQKAKVPADARTNMYRLVRGREAIAGDAPRPYTPPVAPAKEPAAAVIAPWAAPEIPRRSFLERNGAYLGVAALLVLLAWSAWTLAPGPRPAGETSAVVLTPHAHPPKAPANPPPDRKPQQQQPIPPLVANAPQPANVAMTTPEPVEESPADADADADAAAETPEVVEVPAGSLGLVGEGESILLRYDEATRSWDRLLPEAKLSKGDRLVNVAPFRSTVNLGTVRLELVGETQVVIQPPDPEDAARVELDHGQAILVATEPGVVGIGFGAKTVSLTLPLNTPVGVERLTRREPGEAEPAAPSLRILATRGELAVSIGAEKETVSGPGSIEFRPPNHLVEKVSEPSPPWISEETLPPADAERGELLKRFFKPDVSPMRALVEALEDDREPVHKLAIEGLGGIGEIGMVVSAMNRPDAPATRRAAIAFLKKYADGGPEAMSKLREELKNVEGDERAGTVEKLLIGYTPKEAKDPETYALLVKLLAHPEVGVRQLAILNLTALTGRDPLQYDPDKPEGPGLTAWQDLLKSGDLAPRRNNPAG